MAGKSLIDIEALETLTKTEQIQKIFKIFLRYCSAETKAGYMGLNNLIFWILDLRFIVFVLAFVSFEGNFSLHSSFLSL